MKSSSVAAAAKEVEEHVASLVTVQAVLPIDVVITVGRSLPLEMMIVIRCV